MVNEEVEIVLSSVIHVALFATAEPLCESTQTGG